MSAASNSPILVMVTASNEEQAGLIAHSLVGERLAACVNVVGPVRSIYRWAEEVHVDIEYLMLIKTRSGLFSKVEKRVRELHSYEVPEVIAIPIDDGSAPYIDWLLKSTISAPMRTVRRGRLQP
jgi:periplasmic divalent cation tolerance protein